MADTKTKILNAASALFLEKGVNGLSVRAIASQAGVSTIGIYSHFNGKQGILDTLYTEGFARVEQAMLSGPHPPKPRDNIIEKFARYLDIAAENEAHYRLIFGESDANYTPSQDAKRAGVSAFNALVDVVAPALSRASSRYEQQQFAISVWAIAHGYVSLRHHAVQELVDTISWHEQALSTVAALIDAKLSKSEIDS